MMQALKALNNTFRAWISLAALLLMGAGPLLLSAPAAAAPLQQRSLQISDNRPSQTTEYRLSMTLLTPATLGSIRVYFCSDYAILYLPCTAPVGFDGSAATVIAESGVSGFSVDPASTANVLILSRAPAAIAPGPISITLGGVVNQSVASSAFARYHTYATNDGSGPATDEGALAFVIDDDFGVSAEVPPYLLICAAVTIVNNDCSVLQGNLLQLGQFSPQSAATGKSQVVLATNAANGYTLRMHGSTMTSGNNTIPALTAPAASNAGSSQFGVNLRANSNPGGGADPAGPGSGNPAAGYNQPNVYKYISGDVIAGSGNVEDYRKYTVSYLVNISRSQPPGVYSSSFSFIGLGNF